MADFLDVVFSQPQPAEKPAEKKASAPPPVKQEIPIPPPSASPAAVPPPAMAALEARLRALETDLAREKERASTAEIRLKESQSAQNMVEQTLEKLYEKTAKERTEQELRVIREKAGARVEALENRLDEFQKGILDLFKQQSEGRYQKEAESSRTDHSAIENRLAVFQREMLSALESYWDNRERSLAAGIQSWQEQMERTLSVMQGEWGEARRMEGQSAALLREELKLLSSQVEQGISMSQMMLKQKLQDLENRLMLAGNAAEAARLALHAIERIDPLMIEKPLFDELQRIKNLLQKNLH